MSVVIRLQRKGRRNESHFFIVVMDSREKPTGRFIEKLGHYHPTSFVFDGLNYVIDTNKVKKWGTLGAQMSPSVLEIYDKAITSEEKKQ